MMSLESYRQSESGGGREPVPESGHVGGEGRHGEDVVGPGSPGSDGAPDDEIEELWQGGEMSFGSPHQVDIEADLAHQPTADIEHVFVNAESCDEGSVGEATDLERPLSEPQSLTKLLKLPTIIARIGSKKKDPIVNFAKSVILTSDQYISAAQEMRNSKEVVAKYKEQQKVERDESRKYKAVAKEAASARRAIKREEAQRAKERPLAECVEAQAMRIAVRKKAAHTKAICVAELAAGGNPAGTTSNGEANSAAPS
jgi:hypothetical protein